MNILLLGSGGRECTLAWKLSQSALCRALYIAPGNGGTSQYGENIHISPTDFEAVKKICLQHQIDILFPGNEDPLVLGIYDFIKADPALQHIIVVGPSKDGAILEGSKAFSKAFMQRHNIPTAAYAEFSADNYEAGLDYIANHSMPIVLKADGLAAGKGVIIAQTVAEAQQAFKEMIQEAKFGDASSKVVIEAFLSGIELSIFAMTDGDNYLILPEAKDYKRIGEGDTGLNTGGMGAISPVPFADKAFMDKVIAQIIDPTVQGLKAEGRIYQGFIFFGLINVDGAPYVIEYNCRMGDPETEVVIPRLDNDLVELCIAMDKKTLNEHQIQTNTQAAATVMLVSKGYPEAYEKHKVITGVDTVQGSMILHAGTILQDNQLLTAGGRVIAVTSLAKDLKSALQQSYQELEKIDFEGKTYRSDIGFEFIND